MMLPNPFPLAKFGSLHAYGINEPQARELPVSMLPNDELRGSGPTIMNNDVVWFVLVRVVHNEGDSSIRFDP